MLLLLLVYPLTAMSADDYIVGAEDVLKITVYNYPDLTTTERVSGEGIITLPLVGEIRVAGMTTDRVAKTIAEKLADGFIVGPNVSVFVVEFRSKKTVIMGQVNKPGVYMLSGNTTFLELLSLAGGLTKDAGGKATIKRKAPAGLKEEGVVTIDLKKLIEEGNTSLDLPLMEGDSIYIAKAGVFYLTDVNQGGDYGRRFYRQGFSRTYQDHTED
jgi:polysaccharide export outer membrane protein